jgi:hypothetical protein
VLATRTLIESAAGSEIGPNDHGFPRQRPDHGHDRPPLNRITQDAYDSNGNDPELARCWRPRSMQAGIVTTAMINKTADQGSGTEKALNAIPSGWLSPVSAKTPRYVPDGEYSVIVPPLEFATYRLPSGPITRPRRSPCCRKGLWQGERSPENGLIDGIGDTPPATLRFPFPVGGAPAAALMSKIGGLRSNDQGFLAASSPSIRPSPSASNWRN